MNNINEKEHWHVDKKINITHILATISIIISIFIWGSKTDTRISLLEQSLNTSNETQSSINERQDKERRDFFERQQFIDEKQDKERKEIFDNLNRQLTDIRGDLQWLIRNRNR